MIPPLLQPAEQTKQPSINASALVLYKFAPLAAFQSLCKIAGAKRDGFQGPPALGRVQGQSPCQGSGQNPKTLHRRRSETGKDKLAGLGKVRLGPGAGSGGARLQGGGCLIFIAQGPICPADAPLV